MREIETHRDRDRGRWRGNEHIHKGDRMSYSQVVGEKISHKED